MTIVARAGLGVSIELATLHYTFDGSPPDVNDASTRRLAMWRTHIDWDTLTWSYVVNVECNHSRSAGKHACALPHHGAHG